MPMKTKTKKALKIALLALAAILVCVVIYLLYILLSYTRIEDHLPIEVENSQSAVLKTGEEYTITTYNVGFGAYGPEYTFFLDTGFMNDGTPCKGEYGKSISKELTLRNTNGTISELEKLDSDIILLQEVDIKSSRAYNVNMYQMFKDAFPEHSASYASNFHTVYLPYPFNDPVGKTEAGLVTLSRYKIDEVERRSYPISDSLSKLFDLDRCFTISRFPVDNGKELVVINSHMSAYDKGGEIRSQQLDLISEVLTSEYSKGNYVIIGGDFNHILTEEMVGIFPSEQLTPPWIAVLSENDIPEGFSIAEAVNRTEVSTCRSADIPYQKGVNYTAVIDGFIVSDNIRFEAVNIETNYAWSDHQPVELTIVLE